MVALALAGAVGAQAETKESPTRPETDAVATRTQLATIGLMTEVSSAPVLVAQAAPWNSKYDKIIADAKEKKMDVLEYVQANRAAWWWTMNDYIGFSKYYRWLAEQAAIARREQERQLDQATIKAIAENNTIALKLIWTIDANRKKGLKPLPEEIDQLKKIYNHNNTSDEVRKLIQEKFWDLFDFRTLIAQA